MLIYLSIVKNMEGAMSKFGNKTDAFAQIVYEDYIIDIAKNILFWRGSHKVSLFGKEYILPISSFTLLFMAVTLVEKPKLIPSYSFFSLASVMLISMS